MLGLILGDGGNNAAGRSPNSSSRPAGRVDAVSDDSSRDISRGLASRDLNRDGGLGSEVLDVKPEAWPEEMREFVFASEADLYGFATVGAKVCQVVRGSPAHTLGVVPGWYVAAVDGRPLPGALTQGLQRGAPLVTTASLRALLGSRRAAACRSGAPVRLTFWTSTVPDLEAEWLDEDGEEDRAFRKPRAFGSPAGPTAAELVRVLVRQFGTLERAWSEGLDPDNQGGLGYQEFLAGCRRLGIQGDLKGAFKQLDPGSGIVSSRDLTDRGEVDDMAGRCAVCTLPNPCPRHSREEQQDALDRSRAAQKTSMLHRSSVDGK